MPRKKKRIAAQEREKSADAIAKQQRRLWKSRDVRLKFLGPAADAPYVLLVPVEAFFRKVHGSHDSTSSAPTKSV